MYVGYLLDWGKGEVTQYFQTSDWIHFEDIQGNSVSQDTLKRWALWLNSPWSPEQRTYHVESNPNFKNSACPSHSFEQYAWSCYLEVVGYEGACGVIYGYGNTPEEALLDCKAHNQYIQSMYNAKNDSI